MQVLINDLLRFSRVGRVYDDREPVKPEESLDKVIDDLQRLHSRETYSGTGIGLAMCKKIVEAHGGRIWLDTDYTGGACIRFTLPGQRAQLTMAGTDHERSSA